MAAHYVTGGFSEVGPLLAVPVFVAVLGFVVGCAAGAALEVHVGLWALALPVALAVIAVQLGELRRDGHAAQPDPNGAMDHSPHSPGFIINPNS